MAKVKSFDGEVDRICGVFAQMREALQPVMQMLHVAAEDAVLPDDETLQREDKIPFRVGHHFASAIVTYARANGYKPKDFPYAKAVELYAQAIQNFKLPDSTKLPMSEAEREPAFAQTTHTLSSRPKRQSREAERPASLPPHPFKTVKDHKPSGLEIQCGKPHFAFRFA